LCQFDGIDHVLDAVGGQDVGIDEDVALDLLSVIRSDAERPPDG
jgi:hypothetical protein